MSDWTDTILSECVDVINGYAFKSGDFLESPIDNSLPVLKIKNVANGDVHLNGVQYHPYEDTYEKVLIHQSDILLALTGNHPDAKTQVVGQASRYKLDAPSLLNQRVAKIEPKPGVNKDFIYYFMKDKATHDYLASQSSGSANQANISKGTVENTPINLPPLPEQEAIAEVLSSLDDKIYLLHKQNQKLEELADNLFKHWFISEENEEWEEIPLSQVADFLNGLACQKYPPVDENMLPVLKIKELRNGFNGENDWATSNVSQKYIVSNGDVIFSWSGSLLVKIWDGSDCVLNQHLFKVTSNNYQKWFYYLWTKYHLAEFISIAESHATTMGHIKRKDLDEAMVLIPSESELESMNVQMNPIIDKMIANNVQIQKLEKLRDTLLPKLMSGEARVKM